MESKYKGRHDQKVQTVEVFFTTIIDTAPNKNREKKEKSAP